MGSLLSPSASCSFCLCSHSLSLFLSVKWINKILKKYIFICVCVCACLINLYQTTTKPPPFICEIFKGGDWVLLTGLSGTTWVPGPCGPSDESDEGFLRGPVRRELKTCSPALGRFLSKPHQADSSIHTCQRPSRHVGADCPPHSRPGLGLASCTRGRRERPKQTSKSASQQVSALFFEGRPGRPGRGRGAESLLRERGAATNLKKPLLSPRLSFLAGKLK